MVKVYFLYYTPPWVIMLGLVLIGITILNGRFTAFARLVEVLTLFGLMNYFSSFIFAFPTNFNLEYIIPVFDTGWWGFIQGTLFIAGQVSEFLLLLMMIVAFIPDPYKHRRWVVNGIFVSGMVFSAAILIIIAMLSPELAKRIAFGGVNAAKMLQIGDYIRGLEIFIFCTYDYIALGKISLCLYCAWIALQKIFGGQKPKLKLYATGLLVLMPSVWLLSYNKAYFLAVFMGRYILWQYAAFILLLASAAVAIKNRRVGRVST